MPGVVKRSEFSNSQKRGTKKEGGRGGGGEFHLDLDLTWLTMSTSESSG